MGARRWVRGCLVMAAAVGAAAAEWSPRNAFDEVLVAGVPESCMRGGWRRDTAGRPPTPAEENGCAGWADCPPGSFCADADSTKRLCPAGRFGATPKLRDAGCSGPCPAGFACGTGYTNGTISPCAGPDSFCPEGSAVATPVSAGSHTVGASGVALKEHDPTPRVAEVPCGPGFYCTGGLLWPCPAGRFGSEAGLTDAGCSGPCEEGWFCPLASTSPRTISCGRDNPGQYCPQGSARPTPLQRGHWVSRTSLDPAIDIYSEAGFVRQKPCPAGMYCEHGKRFDCPAGRYGIRPEEWDPNCTGACLPGYYCPPRSTSKTAVVCGNSSVFCAGGNGEPMNVAAGYYTYSSTAARYELRPYTTVDADNDGQLTFAEFTSDQTGVLVGSAVKPAAAPDIKELGHLWRYADQDTNGFLDTREFGLVLDIADPYEAWNAQVSLSDFTADRDPDLAVVQTRTAQAPCEPGYFCQAGLRFRCPVGVFSDRFGHTSPACSGPCPEGFYCPNESTLNATQYPCGGLCPSGNETSEDLDQPCRADLVFCPRGSHHPQPVYEGYYTTGGGPGGTHRTGEARCTPGTYCVHGKQHRCRAGRFGDVFGQTNSQCTGPCAPGYFCPEGSHTPEEVQCGDPDVYCPEGSKIPTLVEIGYYSIKGNTTTRTDQALAPPGHYAVRGLLYECPAGRYGATSGLSDPLCSGECRKGYYCPPASVDPRQRVCGGADMICPPASPFPLPVTVGFYTTTSITELCPPGRFRNTTGVVDVSLTRAPDGQEEVNSPIATVTHLGTHGGEGAGDQWAVGPTAPCVLCPAGTYKAHVGDSPALCLPCDRTVSTDVADRTSCECFRAAGGAEFGFLTFVDGECVPSATQAEQSLLLPPRSLENTTHTRHAQAECEPGFWCAGGVRTPCPAGRFGATHRETNPACSGVCDAGYYCPEASTSPKQLQCGRSNLYCPEGSSFPLMASVGYMTNEDRPPELRVSQHICPPGFYCLDDALRRPCLPGRYGASDGQTEPMCDGLCSAGFFCPDEAGTSPTPHACGNATVYCPTGSVRPTPVLPGFYTTHTGPYADRLALNDPFNTTMSAQLLCEPGHWCSGGVKHQCAAGRYGWARGVSSPECNGVCKAGYFCPSHPNTPSLNADQVECGGVHLYCPKGSGNSPTVVDVGYYSVGGNPDNNTRTAQLPCEPGHYCTGAVKHRCPMGTFGRAHKLTDARCSGVCPAGYECPHGTVEPIQCAPGTYATGGAWACVRCPGSHRSSPNPHRETPAKRQTCVNSRSCCG